MATPSRPRRTRQFDQRRYEPGSASARELLRSAAQEAGLPPSWGDDADLHWIMGRESGGVVGRPNYTFGSAITGDPSKWLEVWSRLRKGEVWTKSTATGLGQLLSSNAKKYYPDGLAGIGDAFNEAVGFVRYVHARYGSPAVARSMYAKTGTYVHAVSGKTRSKTFKEGY